MLPRAARTLSLSRSGSESSSATASPASHPFDVRDLAWNGATAAAYWAVAELMLLSGEPGARVTPMWAPAGVALAAVLLRGYRVLPGVLAGAFVPTMLHLSPSAGVLVAAGMAAQCLVDVFLLRLLKFDQHLERVRDPLILAGVTLAGGAVSAAFGLPAVRIAGGDPDTGRVLTFVLWWMREWLGALVVASLVLTWVRSKPIAWTWARAGEAVALLVGMLILSQLIFGLWAFFPGQHLPTTFVLFPVVGYAAMRFGPAGAATLTALVAAFALPAATMGVGPFGVLSTDATVGVLHAFVLLTWLSGQTLAAVRAEWRAALHHHIALEEQLRHSQKMEAVGRLAGGIAHDFNNLLTAIMGYAELLMLGHAPDDPRRSDAEEIARAAMRAADLTRQMLAFSRKQTLQATNLDLNVALAKVEPMLRRVIGEDIVMTLAPRATRPQVRADAGQIEQVLMNLVVNARDAMPHGGQLRVETADASPDMLPASARAGEYILLAVSDTGTGMTPDVRARIFEPYFTTKEAGKGTGLGLSTAYGIIRQSDGHIQVQSEPGLGTTFRIYLPRVEATVTHADAGAPAHLPGGTEHVLLVEDDPSVRRLSRDILGRLGYSVTEAASGRAAVALGSDDTRHFDLAVCDVILGDMSGPAVYESLRALRPGIRVLYMSGYADEAIDRTGVLAEGQPFLQKPFTPRDLAMTVRDVLNREEDD